MHPPWHHPIRLSWGATFKFGETMKKREFEIPFSGLKQGKHEFHYVIDNGFFESFDYKEFNAAHIELTVLLTKLSTMMELEFSAEGMVNVDCDRSGEPFDLPISGTLELIVKFGDAFNDDDDELLVLPHGEHQVDIGQYVYEMLVLAVPTKRVHPGVLDGSLKSEALKKLKELEPRENKDNTDPRWDALKDLITDK